MQLQVLAMGSTSFSVGARDGPPDRYCVMRLQQFSGAELCQVIGQQNFFPSFVSLCCPGSVLCFSFFSWHEFSSSIPLVSIVSSAKYCLAWRSASRSDVQGQELTLAVF